MSWLINKLGVLCSYISCVTKKKNVFWKLACSTTEVSKHFGILEKESIYISFILPSQRTAKISRLICVFVILNGPRQANLVLIAHVSSWKTQIRLTGLIWKKQVLLHISYCSIPYSQMCISSVYCFHFVF